MKNFLIIFSLSVFIYLVDQKMVFAVDYDEKTIKDASPSDIKKWLKYDDQDQGSMIQWKLLATRNEKLSWWNEVIGFHAVIIRNQCAEWDPSVKRGKYIVDISPNNGSVRHTYYIAADLPNEHTNETLLHIHFISCE